MPRKLFLGGARIDTVAQLVGIAAADGAGVARADRAALLQELWAKRADIAAWCRDATGAARVTLSDGREVVFAQIASADEPAAASALASLAGCAPAELLPGAAFSASGAPRPPRAVAVPVVPGAASGAAPGAASGAASAVAPSKPSTGHSADAPVDGEAMRRAIELLPWYESDRMDDVEDWSLVACSTEGLHRVLARIGGERTASFVASADQAAWQPNPVTVHLCHMGDGCSFDVLGLRFEHVRFKGHGGPLLTLTEPLLQHRYVLRSLDATPGLAIADCRVSAPCLLGMRDADRFQNVSIVHE